MNIDLQRNGFCIISNKDSEFSQQVEKAKALIYKMVSEDRLPNAGFLNAENKPRQLVNLHWSFSDMKKLVNSAVIKSIAKELLPGQRVIVDHSKASIKFQGSEMEWRAHQDNGYGERSGYSVAIMLEQCSEKNGTIQLIPGSHLNGCIPHERSDEDQQAFIPACKLDEKIYPACGSQSDILIFDLNTIHRSGNNDTDTLRAIFIFEISPEKYMMSDGHSMPFFIIGRCSAIEFAVSLTQYIGLGIKQKIRTKLSI